MRKLEEQFRATQSRYLERKERRAQRHDHLTRLGKGGDWRQVDEPDRVRARLERLGLGAVVSEAMADLSETRGVPRVQVLERIMGKSELMGVSFLLKGASVSRTVGRVVIRSANGIVQGYGTGFLVSPRLLLTNNHVLEDVATASTSVMQFTYYETFGGQVTIPVEFALEPSVFFETDEVLDFTLVAVREVNPDGIEIRSFGWNPLIRESGKAVVGERVNIIQHPGGEPMQLALRQNAIVDVYEDFLHYETDTQPGSSGSPVFNDQWEVAALHHSGVPKTNPGGQILLTTGIPWDRSRSTMHLIDWVANEGVRISKIVQFLEGRPLSLQQRRLLEEAFLASPAPETSPPEAGPPLPMLPQTPHPGMVIESDGSVSWLVRINVGLIGGGGGSIALSQGLSPTPPIASRQLTDLGSAGTTTTPEDRPKYRDAKAWMDTESRDEPYYDREKDAQAKSDYYRHLPSHPDPARLFQALQDLLTRTHVNMFSYRAARWNHLYPRVDRHETGKLRNIYSGTILDPVEVLREEMVLVEEMRRQLMRQVDSEAFATDEERLEYLDFLEAQLPFNCEHVVPQSWFAKKQPMRADLHHLFACEPDCNSFRGNTPYYEFSPVDEVVRDDCGRREADKFEPEFRRGAVARATLYFLLRYPGQIGDAERELQRERLDILKHWHKTYPVDRYELHRNATISEVQGNRNPLIDFPEWVDKIDFTRGFGNP